MIRRHMFKFVGIALVLGAAACSGESKSESDVGAEKARMSTSNATTATKKTLGITTWHTAWEPKSKAILLDGADDKGEVKFSLIVRKDADGVGHVDSYRAGKGSLTIAADGTQTGSLDVDTLKKYMDAMNGDWEKSKSKETTEYAFFLPLLYLGGAALAGVCANSDVCKDVLEGAWCKVADSTLCAEREQKYEEAKQKAQEAKQKREQQTKDQDKKDDEEDDKADEDKDQDKDQDQSDEDKDQDKDQDQADEDKDQDQDQDQADSSDTGEGNDETGELTGDEMDNNLDENGGADDSSDYGDDSSSDDSSDYSDDSSSDDSSSDDSSSDDSSSDDSSSDESEYAAHHKTSKAHKGCKKLSCSKSSKACMCRRY